MNCVGVSFHDEHGGFSGGRSDRIGAMCARTSSLIEGHGALRPRLCVLAYAPEGPRGASVLRVDAEMAAFRDGDIGECLHMQRCGCKVLDVHRAPEAAIVIDRIAGLHVVRGHGSGVRHQCGQPNADEELHIRWRFSRAMGKWNRMMRASDQRMKRVVNAMLHAGLIVFLSVLIPGAWRL